MKINKILTMVAQMLDLDLGIVAVESTDKKTLALLVRAFNNVVSEIAEEYVPFVKETKVQSVDGEIDLSGVGEKVYKVVKVENEKGEKVRFCEKIDKIILKDKKSGEYRVVYSYIPSEIGFGESVEIPSVITERTLSYGVAGEYALMSERYDECINYDTRFNTALTSATRKVKERKLPYRGYV